MLHDESLHVQYRLFLVRLKLACNLTFLFSVENPAVLVKWEQCDPSKCDLPSMNPSEKFGLKPNPSKKFTTTVRSVRRKFGLKLNPCKKYSV
jgi:hypothetical protein